VIIIYLIEAAPIIYDGITGACEGDLIIIIIISRAEPSRTSSHSKFQHVFLAYVFSPLVFYTIGQKIIIVIAFV